MPALAGSPALVPTPRGDARVYLDLPSGPPRALLALGHGAGGGVGAPDLVALTAAAVGAGLAVARVEQPYRVAGRRAPPPAGVLDEAWVAVLAELRAAHPGLALVVGGRSSGARVACRTANAVGAAAVVALAFPTRPPGRAGRPGQTGPTGQTGRPDRLGELGLPAVPVLVVQGERDPFGVPPPGPGRTVVVIGGADHSFRRHAGQAALAVLDWLATHGWCARSGHSASR
jgi:uncharacterized protein